MTSPLAVVTGSSRGLGRAWSAALVAAGWTVIGDGRDRDRLRATARDLGARFVAIPGDVTAPAHRTQLADAVEDRGGRLDLLVHNAGALGPSPLPRLLDVDTATMHDLLDVNLVAPLALTRALLDPLESARGTVVAISSDVVAHGWAGWGAYGLTKAALEHAAGTLASEHPSLRVLVLDPGDVRTAMHQAAFPGEDISDRAEPGTVGPAIVAAVVSDAASGSRLRAGDLLGGDAPTAVGVAVQEHA